MRLSALNELVSIEGRITPIEQRREDEIEQHGNRCAAWLIRDIRRNPKTRASFRAHREANVEINRSHFDQIPVWFTIALETLRRRDGWLVIVQSTSQKRVYVIRWLR